MAIYIDGKESAMENVNATIKKIRKLGWSLQLTPNCTTIVCSNGQEIVATTSLDRIRTLYALTKRDDEIDYPG